MEKELRELLEHWKDIVERYENNSVSKFVIDENKRCQADVKDILKRFEESGRKV